PCQYEQDCRLLCRHAPPPLRRGCARTTRSRTRSASARALTEQALQRLAILLRELVGRRRFLLPQPPQRLSRRLRRHPVDLHVRGQAPNVLGDRLAPQGDADRGDAGQDGEEAEEGPTDQGEHAAILPPFRAGASRGPVGTWSKCLEP